MFSVEREAFANYVRRAAKFAFPQTRADHCYRGRATLIVGRQKTPTEDRLHGKYRKEI